METQAVQSAGRRILAGIDEAGFGPILGPLVIGATAWCVPDDCTGEDLWQRLRGGVTRAPSKRYARLAINDSKKIYSTQKGLLDLERGVLGTLAVQGGTDGEAGADVARLAMPDGFARFLDRVAHDWVEQVTEHPWYAGCSELALPVDNDVSDLNTRANGLRVALRRNGVSFLGAGLELVLESRFNRLCDAMGNKGRLLFCCTARLIQRLLDRFGRDRLTVICDKHGGRDSYSQLLLEHWPNMHLVVLGESAEGSGYRMEDRAAGRAMEIWFFPEADLRYLPASLASMYCKYTRELFMKLLNNFWQTHAGEPLKPTAGYYGDGSRFVRQVTETARRLGLPADSFIRKR